MKNTFDMFLEYISVNYHIMITMYYLYVLLFLYYILYYKVVNQNQKIIYKNRSKFMNFITFN